MTALEKVMQLKKEGKAEGEIIASLRSEGLNPMQISDALNQSKIKEAIVDPNPTEGMTPSIMGDEEKEEEAQTQVSPPQEEDYYVPKQTQSAYSPQPPPAFGYGQQSPQQYSPQYPPSQYSGGQYGGQEQSEEQFQGYDENYQGEEYSGFSNSTDTMIEVAEQVFAEKVKKLSKELQDLNEFKTIFEIKVENINERLKRMEKNFDKMQLDILGKVSEYGKGLDYVKKELDMVQDNFGKVMKGL